MSTFTISNQPLTIEQLESLHSDTRLVADETVRHSVINCREYLDKKMASGDGLFYGINTGFGYLQNVRIDDEQLETLQANLLKSHACGLGDEVPATIVKWMLFLKIRSLCYGHSGVQWETVQRLIDFYNEDILPVVYTQGSLGASGDLAPLSHLCLPLIGMGEVNHRGVRKQAHDVLRENQWHPISLKSKEGLALINGTQFMCAYGIHILINARRLFRQSNRIAALSFDAFDGVLHPFDAPIHAIRAHRGQIAVAADMRSLLETSAIARQPKSQVQDPYSFRCIPQVHGATKDTLDYVTGVFIQEVNAVTDNPNIFPDEDLIISGGNFHGQPLALALDFMAIALSELANISERRTYQLISGLRGLPPFLVKNPGLNSGFMIPQYTAAGIVSENKQLCTPSSVDSIPSSINQEDHVSMGANGAVKCNRVVVNLEKVLAIEWMTAAQAIEFRRPARSSELLEDILVSYRNVVSFNEQDRYLHHDMISTIQFLQKNNL
ncbi:MAG: histidine ammonia-lyase [Ferruginibacter sp.]